MFKLNLKQLLILFLGSICSNQVISQTVLLSEDFSTALGSTPPAGWTIQTTVGDPVVDVWRFDNPGRRVVNAPISGNFACFDSDRYSDNGLAEEVYLVSPVFNATIADDNEIWIEFDQYFLAGYNGACAVELFNGISWVSIYSNNVTTNNPNYFILNISTHLRNKTNAQVRFKWTGNFSYHWIVDNIKIKVIPSSQIFIEQTGIILQAMPALADAVWGDLDNDGDFDIVFTGSSTTSSLAPPTSKIYINNNGVFQELPTILINVKKSSVKLCDYNNDGLLDIFIAGRKGQADYSGGSTVKIYKNLGNLVFTEIANSIKGVGNGFIDLADYDNDGKKDLLVVGDDGFINYAKIFRNIGEDIFDEQSHIIINSIGSGGWLDYDSDGLIDFMVGNVFYKNEGNGTFSIQEMYGQNIGKNAFFDYGNNGKIDILSNSNVYHFNNYTNRFDYVTSNLPASLFECFDYNNDGFIDLLRNDYTSKTLYKNDGTLTFTNQPITFPIGGYGSPIKAADFDNDGTVDIFIGGVGKLFKNNIKIPNSLPTAPLLKEPIVDKNSVKLSWYPSTDMETPSSTLTYNLKVGTEPGEEDIMSAQSLPNGKRLVHDYGNTYFKTNYELKNLKPGTYYWSVQAIDGIMAGGEFSVDGQFLITENNSASLIYFSNIHGNNVTATWARGSGEKCIVFCKEGIDDGITLNNSSTYRADPIFGDGDQFENTGWYCVYKGAGSKVTISNLKPLTNYTLQVFEFDGNEANESYYSGYSFNNPNSIKTVTFTNLPYPSSYIGHVNTIEYSDYLFGGQLGSIIFSDFDSDGDFDMIANGAISKDINTTAPWYTSFYSNNGSFNFINKPSLWALRYSNMINNDFNNDNCLDFIEFGRENLGAYNIYLLKNNCIGNYSKYPIPFTDIREGSVAWADIDNDGDNDVFVSGNGIAKLYRNVYSTFEVDTINTFTGLTNSRVAWGDFNNDNYIDLLITGHNGTKPISTIYQNLGNGVISKRDDISLVGVSLGAVDIGDYNNDGKLDLLITGNNGVKDVSLVYKNTGSNFELQTGITLTGVSNGDAYWVDFNNDNFLDIIIAGNNIIKVYTNNNDGTFTEQLDNPFITRDRPRIAIGDLDNDGDVDFASLGGDSKDINIYRNDLLNPSLAINSPSNLKTVFGKNIVEFKWDKLKTSDNIENVLSYNIEIWNQDSIFCSSLSNDNGSRKVAKIGNAQKNNSYIIKNLPLGTYYWRVQAINNSFIGGTWSETKQFTVKELQADFFTDRICLGDSTQFTDNSFYAGLTIENYFWDFGDGTTSNQFNPKHKYSNYGEYIVKYKISSENFVDSVYQTVVVKERPKANFELKNACEGDNVHFTDLSTAQDISITQWDWDYGDGKRSSLQNPLPNTYLKGNYVIKLKSIADNGCWDTITKPLTVVPYPNATLSLEYGEPNFCFGDSTCYSAIYNNNWDYQWQLNNENISERNNTIKIKSRQGDYRVIISHKVVNTCIDTSTQKTITIIAPPPTPIIKETNNKTLFCMGEDVELLIDNFSSSHSYQWKRFGANIDNATGEYLKGKLAAGDYTVQASTEFCHVLSNKLTLTNKPALPKPTVLGQGPTIWTLACDNMTARGYRWYFNNNLITDANGYQYYANKNYGDYYVTVNDGGECWTPSDVFRTSVANNVDALTDEKVKIYPNPSEGIFNVSLGVDIAGVVNVRIVDVLGKVVFIQNYNTSDFPVDISQVTKGIYYFSIMYKNEIIIKKVVKQ